MATFSGINEHSIYPDLIRHLSKKGHDVYVLLPNEKKNNQRTFVEKTENIHIWRVQTGNLFNVGMVTKLISRAGVARKYIRAIKKHLDHIKFDLILYSTPPTTFYKVVDCVKKRDNSYTYLMLKDIFPQNAVDLGMIRKNSLIYRLLRVGEKKLYKISDTIGCMSPANVDFILNQNPWIDPKRIEVCPNALELIIHKFPSKREIREKYNIPIDKVVFVYGGGLGNPQGIDFLLSCIEKIPDNSKFFFLVCGDGLYFERLREMKSRYPQKLQLIKWLPVNEYNAIVSAADVGLVFLDHKFQIPNFPSRILLYMECALPILAATDKSSDVGKIAVDNGFGDWCESIPENVDLFIKKMELFTIPETITIMGRKSKEFLERNYTVETVYDTIFSHVDE